jgi:hypothetical protein
MARKKKMRFVQSSEDYLSEQIQTVLQGQPSSQTQENIEFSLESELPAGGVDVVVRGKIIYFCLIIIENILVIGP